MPQERVPLLSPRVICSCAPAQPAHRTQHSADIARRHNSSFTTCPGVSKRWCHNGQHSDNTRRPSVVSSGGPGAAPAPASAPPALDDSRSGMGANTGMGSNGTTATRNGVTTPGLLEVGLLVNYVVLEGRRNARRMRTRRERLRPPLLQRVLLDRLRLGNETSCKRVFFHFSDDLLDPAGHNLTSFWVQPG